MDRKGGLSFPFTDGNGDRVIVTAFRLPMVNKNTIKKRKRRIFYLSWEKHNENIRLIMTDWQTLADGVVSLCWMKDAPITISVELSLVFAWGTQTKSEIFVFLFRVC